jgi:hypothetical protein
MVRPQYRFFFRVADVFTLLLLLLLSSLLLGILQGSMWFIRFGTKPNKTHVIFFVRFVKWTED